MDYRYKGIIISKRDIMEVDRIYSIYTLEAGKVRVVGKGVRKSDAKLAGHLEPVTYSEISIAKGKGRGKITGAMAVDDFGDLKTNFSALQRTFYIFGMLDRLVTEQEKDERMFELLLGYLEAMDRLCSRPDGELKMDVLTFGFVFQFLDILGYKLEMERCANCGRRLVPEGNYFSISSGGAICKECQPGERRKISITSGAIKLIRIFLKNKIRNMTKLEVSKRDMDNVKMVANESLRWIAG